MLIVSVLAQITVVYDLIVFRSSAIMGDADGSMPQVWTLFTCLIFESSLFFLGLHLLILNYLVNQLEQVWSRSSFIALVLFSAFWTNLIRFGGQVAFSHLFESKDLDGPSLTTPYCSINHLILIILMGCR